ncbi:helix-turn-helix transcriptional regulator [Lactiplantibacillus sp. DA1]|uniref:helix-turn-helix domain-containing protein n=1 Tax=Lactiplantibacillus sp. DA1 TaxID=3079857 RepID=UPI00292A66BB|nr:helix-turn-helix transcriptional regulator [Lactiplantibacillus sp. DA1]MDV0430701.1 helix-turn-helix transcriptional regulator [Lactiplantibacillus sp. DA1]
MNIPVTQLLTLFHQGTNYATYTFNQHYDLLTSYTSPVTPTFNTKWLNKLVTPNESSKNISLAFLNQVGLIATFPYQNDLIAIWNHNVSVQGNENYSDEMPLSSLTQFKANLQSLFIELNQVLPKFSSAQLAAVDEALTRITHKPRDFMATEPHAYYQGYLTEQQMLLGVEHGNLTEFNRYYVPFMAAGNFGRLASYDLRSKKNITIAATTLFTRAAIRGGVFAEVAYGLSDQCIQTAERQTDITNVYEYTREIGELFLKNVARVKRQNIPSIIYLAQEYIYDHVLTVKNVSTVSEHVHASDSYLMHLFKETTGTPLMQFIITQKIEYAKLQLIFTTKSIGEVADELSFANQGELTRAFKKQTGQTPLKFRQQQQIV